MIDKEKLENLKKLADEMYYAAQYLTTDASRLRKTMEDYRQFIIQEWHKEEPVSEDLEDAAKYYIPDESYHMIIESKEEGSGENVYDYIQMIDMFKAGAKWKEQWMMKDAIEYTILDQNELSTEVATFPPNQGLGKIREGDNVKIIIVKEN